MTRKKLPNVYKKWSKIDFTRKMKDLEKIIVAIGLEKLPKVQ